MPPAADTVTEAPAPNPFIPLCVTCSEFAEAYHVQHNFSKRLATCKDLLMGEEAEKGTRWRTEWHDGGH